MTKINDYMIISYHIDKGDITKFCACAIEKNTDLTIKDVREKISTFSVPEGAELHIDNVQRKLSSPEGIPLIPDIQNIFDLVVQEIKEI